MLTPPTGQKTVESILTRRLCLMPLPLHVTCLSHSTTGSTSWTSSYRLPFWVYSHPTSIYRANSEYSSPYETCLGPRLEVWGLINCDCSQSSEAASCNSKGPFRSTHSHETRKHFHFRSWSFSMKASTLTYTCNRPCSRFFFTYLRRILP
jgi:hypothetical protein